MSVNKPDISLIEKYLNGELDARAMHELERQALDDPFLADALEGYAQKQGSSVAHLQELNRRLQQRIQPESKRLGLLTKLSMAATVLIFVSIGSWYWLFNQPSASVEDTPTADKTEVVKTPPVTTIKPNPQIVQPELKPAAPRLVATKPRLKNKRVKANLLADVRADSSNAALARLVELKFDSVNNTSPDRANLVAANNKVKQKAKENLGRQLDEVVVVGYGTQHKQSITGSVATVEPQSIQSALVGRVAGIAVSPAGRKNKPGSSKSIQIRGISSINKDRQPLFIVDGKVVDKINGINPDNIASVNVLKDSSAAAIYGSRATNGVIIIKTKTIGTVKGQVISADDQSPLPGVTVKIKGTNKAVQTNADGKFTIDADKNAELVFAYIGYNTREKKVKGTDSLKISLTANSGALSEVVVARTEHETEKDLNAHPINGWKDFNNYLKEEAQSPDGKTGVVRVSFTVNSNNTISDIKIIKSLSAGADAKAVELIKDYQGWAANADGTAEKVKIRIRFSK